MTDKILPLGDGTNSVRLKGMGDGTVARVIAASSSSAASTGDKLAELGDGTSKIRLRDMGDGTVAEVKFGV